jgi:hypothetical protein
MVSTQPGTIYDAFVYKSTDGNFALYVRNMNSYNLVIYDPQSNQITLSESVNDLLSLVKVEIQRYKATCTVRFIDATSN